MDKIIITSNEANQRLDRFLRKYLKDVSLSEIYKMLRKKEVKVNGQKVKENYRLNEGDILEIRHDAEKEPHTVKEADMDFSIVYEDDNILIADKPQELILHPDANHKNNTLVDQVIYYLYKNGKYNPENETTFKPAAVNRLDVNTGGIVLFAKNYKALQSLNEIIREENVKKYYICVVKGKVFGDMDITAYLIKDNKNNIVKISDNKIIGSKEIHTKFKVLKTTGEYSLLEIDLITGRSHQIRAQLSHIGHPIIGDMKYGDSRENKYFKDRYGLTNQLLYAYRLVFQKTTADLKYLEGRSFLSCLPYKYNFVIKCLFDYTMDFH